MDALKVIDVDEGILSVYTKGCGIRIEIPSTYIPKSGHLLSGSNYDDERKLTGVRFGAKLAGIYSHEFIEAADKKSQQKYKQTWTTTWVVAEKPKLQLRHILS